MSDQLLAEIRVFPFSFAPVGWAFCRGQLLPISQNTALFSLLGTTYGGDGRSNFALPNLQGSSIRGRGQGPGLSDVILGEVGGSETVTLLLSELPAHTHTAAFTVDGNHQNALAASPANGAMGNALPALTYSTAGTTLVEMSPLMMGPVGGSQAHENRQPFIVINYCIALQGYYPARA